MFLPKKYIIEILFYLKKIHDTENTIFLINSMVIDKIDIIFERKSLVTTQKNLVLNIGSFQAFPIIIKYVQNLYLLKRQNSLSHASWLNRLSFLIIFRREIDDLYLNSL